MKEESALVGMQWRDARRETYLVLILLKGKGRKGRRGREDGC